MNKTYESPMMKDIAEVLVSQEQVAQRVKELGAQISKDYEGKEVVLLCVLKGAVVFFSDLARAMTIPMTMDFMSISSYGDSQKTSGIVRINKDIDSSITGKHVIIAEDIMDSGLTLSYLTRLLSDRQPASLRVCALLDKPERRECEITPDYCGFTIPNRFVVGYGLDYKGYYRNLPYVGVLSPKVYEED